MNKIPFKAWVLIGLVFIVCFGAKMYWSPSFRNWVTKPPYNHQKEVEMLEVQPQAGTIEIDSTEWRGVTCLKGRVSGKILTDDLYWQVRLDKDDNRIYTLYPRNWKPGSALSLSNFNVMEWRVKSGQKDTKALIAWSIDPNG